MNELGSDLRRYSSAKQSLGDLLQQLLAALGAEEDAPEAERVRSLIARLAEDRFTIAVVGQFNRGKSTLLNAMLGRKILPTGALPVTSVVTSLTYGTEDRALVRRADRSTPSAVSLESISDYITETGNPGNGQRIKEVVIETAFELGRRGVSFVDTPGIASARAQNTATTYAFLPSLDAVIFVTSADSAMTAPEMDLLAEAARFAQKVFVVVNKIDLIEAADVGRIVDWVKEKARRICSADPPIYPLSSLEALASRKSGASDGPAHSGFAALFGDVERFLAERGTEALLLSLLEKAIRLASEVEARAQATDRIRTMGVEGGQRLREDLARRVEEAEQEAAVVFAALNDRLAAFADTVAEEGAAAMASSWKTHLQEATARLPMTDASETAAEESLRKELADLQTGWLAHRLAQLDPSAVTVVRTALDRIEGAISRVDRLPDGEGGWVRALGQDGTPFSIAALEIAPLPVQPAFGGTRVSRASEILPAAWRGRFVRSRLRKLIDLFVEESRERVRSACAASLSILVDSVRRDVQRELRRRRRVLSEPTEAPGATGPAESETAHRVLRDLAALRRSIVSGPTEDPVAFTAAPAKPLRAWVNVPREPHPPTTARTRCMICVPQGDALFDLLAQWQFLLSRDADFREAFVHERGLCPLHTWQIEQIASPQTISFGFAPLLKRLAGTVDQLAELPEWASQNAEPLVPDARSCAVCIFLAAVEKQARDRLIEELAAAEGRQAYESSFGLCLPHLVAALSVVQDATTREVLLRHEARKMEETADEMKSYSIKRDSLRRALLRDNEERAWHSALRRIVGERNASVSRRIDRLI